MKIRPLHDRVLMYEEDYRDRRSVEGAALGKGYCLNEAFTN